MAELIVERNEGIVTLTINRPERKNAITGEMWVGLGRIFDEIANNRDDRVLVITGAGDAFCSGADLSPGGDAQEKRRAGFRAVASMRPVGRGAGTAARAPDPHRCRGERRRRGRRLQPALGCDLIIVPIAPASPRSSPSAG